MSLVKLFMPGLLLTLLFNCGSVAIEEELNDTLKFNISHSAFIAPVNAESNTSSPVRAEDYISMSERYGHEGYSLENDRAIEEYLQWGRSGQWSSWAKCENIHGENSLVYSFKIFEINDRDFEKARISCRSMTSAGMIDPNDYTLSDHFFDTNSGNGSQYVGTIDNSYLPYGVFVNIEYSKAADFELFYANANAILETGQNERWGYTGNIIDGNDESTFLIDGYYAFLSCPSYHVMTGMRLNYDLNISGSQAEITGMEIQCTPLEWN
ncbi:MAG: hypothetical protein ABIA04_00910 [Pseudomonadota bacterium]